MEFRGTEPPPPPLSRPPSPQHPAPSLSFVGYRNPGFGMRNGIGIYNQGMGRTDEFLRLGIAQASGNFQMMNNVNVQSEILRELEKQRIRQEIISGDFARRRLLEEEVKAELMMEREMGLRLRGGIAYDRYLVQGESGGFAVDARGISYAQEANKGITLGERFGVRSEEGLKMQARSEIQGLDIVPFQQRRIESRVQVSSPSGQEAGLAVEPRGVLLLQEGDKRLSLEERIATRLGEGLIPQSRCETQAVPFQRRSVESKVQEAAPSVSENGNQKEKIVFLAKPSADLSRTKRKFEPPGNENVCEFSTVGNKRGKKTWRCDLCQVSATSEIGLNDHLGGKKHKAMEESLISKVTGKNIGIGVQPKTSAEPVTEAGKEGGGRKFTPVAKSSKTKDKKKFKFWCEMCQIGAYSETVMEAHKNGKTHSMMLSKS